MRRGRGDVVDLIVDTGVGWHVLVYFCISAGLAFEGLCHLRWDVHVWMVCVLFCLSMFPTTHGNISDILNEI